MVGLYHGLLHSTSPVFIPELEGRMFTHSSSLEEGYCVPLVLGFCHYIYRATCHPLAFDLMLRVHVNRGLAQFQNHGPHYVEIH